MSYKIQISLIAEMEIKSAQDWYEKQSPGLGERVADEVKETIESLLNPIYEHKLVHKKLRRILLPRFPYAIYYMRDETQKLVEVIAVLHDKQSKDGLQNRL